MKNYHYLFLNINFDEIWTFKTSRPSKVHGGLEQIHNIKCLGINTENQLKMISIWQMTIKNYQHFK